MSELYPGQEVVAVGYTGPDTRLPPREYNVTVPIRGQHYRVREINFFGGILLQEIVNGLDENGFEFSFHCRGFRPINPDAIEWAREMCRDAERKVRA